jgi:hypothetical protein
MPADSSAKASRVVTSVVLRPTPLLSETDPLIKAYNVLTSFQSRRRTPLDRQCAAQVEHELNWARKELVAFGFRAQMTSSSTRAAHCSINRGTKPLVSYTSSIASIKTAVTSEVMRAPRPVHCQRGTAALLLRARPMTMTSRRRQLRSSTCSRQLRAQHRHPLLLRCQARYLLPRSLPVSAHSGAAASAADDQASSNRNGGLSGGAVACIVLTVIVSLVALAIAFCVRARNRHGSSRWVRLDAGPPPSRTLPTQD